MADSSFDETPLTSDDQLFSPFQTAEKPAQQLGLEMEKFGVRADGSPIDYDGPQGVLRFFEALAPLGWHAEGEVAGGPLLSLSRDGGSVTLEPGSQLELSGGHHDDVHAVQAELDHHLHELRALSSQLGVQWLGLGFHPFAKRADYNFVPKLRYGVMREYLPTRGPLALDMMLRTSTVQINLDYASEADAMRKLRLGQRLSALTTALFANSPFYEGAPFGGKSYRAKVWLGMDPDRSGLLPRLFADDSSYRDYVEWALDVPMFMLKRGDAVHHNAGQSFRAFLRDGFEGVRACVGDWVTHLNTLFPEVRLKRTIEIRGADSQSGKDAPGLAALYAGLFYDARALDQLDALTAGLGFAEVQAAREQVVELGLQAQQAGKPLQKLGEQVLEIAEGGLERRARRNAQGDDERVHLASLKARLARGECPADEVLRKAQAGGLSREAILAASRIELP